MHCIGGASPQPPAGEAQAHTGATGFRVPCHNHHHLSISQTFLHRNSDLEQQTVHLRVWKRAFFEVGCTGKDWMGRAWYCEEHIAFWKGECFISLEKIEVAWRVSLLCLNRSNTYGNVVGLFLGPSTVNWYTGAVQISITDLQVVCFVQPHSFAVPSLMHLP